MAAPDAHDAARRASTRATVRRPTRPAEHRHPHRCGGSLGDRGHARVGVAGSESRQLVDENLVPCPSCPPLDPMAWSSRVAAGYEPSPRPVLLARRSHRIVAPVTPRCEPLPVTSEDNCWVSICTTVRVHPVFMSHHGRMHAQRQGGTSRHAEHRPTPAGGASAHPRVTSFRSRRSALTERPAGDVGAALAGAGHAGAIRRQEPAEPLDAGAWFGRQAPLVLEIGCGTGTSTLAMAQAEPGIDVVAVEVYRRGLAQLLGAIDREGVTNIRLIRGDGVDVLEHMVGPGSLTGVRVFFPDPWPKSRHHKRRLLKPETVALIADRLRPGGVLHAATDHAGYAEQIAEVGDAEPLLRRVEPGEPLPISVQRPTTKYEEKARHAGTR